MTIQTILHAAQTAMSTKTSAKWAVFREGTDIRIWSGAELHTKQGERMKLIGIIPPENSYGQGRVIVKPWSPEDAPSRVYLPGECGCILTAI